MVNKINYLITSAIMLILLIYFVPTKTKTEDKNIVNSQMMKAYSQDSIINELKQMQMIVMTDRRLFQHFIAVKYSKFPATTENIKNFITEAKLSKQLETYAVAKLETNNGLTGIGKAPRNNHFGLTLASTRFSWNEKQINNYCSYSSWPFSYLDYEEYVQKGYKTWQTNAVSKVFKKTKHKK